MRGDVRPGGERERLDLRIEGDEFGNVEDVAAHRIPEGGYVVIRAASEQSMPELKHGDDQQYEFRHTVKNSKKQHEQTAGPDAFRFEVCLDVFVHFLPSLGLCSDGSYGVDYLTFKLKHGRKINAEGALRNFLLR